RPVGREGEKPAARPKGRDEPADLDQLVVRLDSESYSERCEAQEGIEQKGKEGLAAVVAALDEKRFGVRGRSHAVWVVAKVGGPAMVKRLFALAKADPEPRVQAQAVRAIADLTDPGLVKHRIEAGPGDADIAKQLTFLAPASEPQGLLEIVIALGRLRWP